jgi:hypothetical protein
LSDTSLSDVLSYVRNQSTRSDLDAIQDAIKAARPRLAAEAAAKLSVGTEVTISGLSPKYLNGLRGNVVSIRGQRFDLQLDEASTNRVRGTKHGPFEYGDTKVERHAINGIPVQCAVIG